MFKPFYVDLWRSNMEIYVVVQFLDEICQARNPKLGLKFWCQIKRYNLSVVVDCESYLSVVVVDPFVMIKSWKLAMLDLDFGPPKEKQTYHNRRIQKLMNLLIQKLNYATLCNKTSALFTTDESSNSCARPAP
jgi:hypothetical protein